MKSDKIIEYHEPHHFIECADCLVTISVDDAIKHMRKANKRYQEYTDEFVLLDFLVLHHAKFKEI